MTRPPAGWSPDVGPVDGGQAAENRISARVPFCIG